MGISLTGSRDRNLSRRCFKVDTTDAPAVPVRIIHLEHVGMEFHGGGGYAFRNLRASLQACAATSTERFIIDDHTTGV